MTADELVRAIQNVGGVLIPQLDGQLLCRNVPPEFRDELKAKKADVIAFLLAPPTAIAPGNFSYRPRTNFENRLRATQREGLLPTAVVENPRLPPRSKAGASRPERCRYCEHYLEDGNDLYCETCRAEVCRVEFCVCGRGKH
jgi:hypothetical protein